MNFKELFPLRVVINLDKRPDRLKICMEEEFPKLDIVPIRKPGVLFTESNNNWINGTIGCMVSHYHILQSALLLDQNVMIFEDDIKFLGLNTLEVLDMCCEDLDKMEWDMFYGGGNILKPFYKVSDRLAKLSHCQSTVFYGVNKKFIPELLKYIDLKNIRVPIDVIYAERVIPNHNCFISYPMLGIQRDSYSDIELQEVKYSEYLQKRYWDNLKEGGF
jgi:GR25 family glycosyltransferase involved in LPS biosynthesis